MSGAGMSSAETAAPNRRRRNVPDPPYSAIYINHPTSHYEPVLSDIPNGAFLQEQNES